MSEVIQKQSRHPRIKNAVQVHISLPVALVAKLDNEANSCYWLTRQTLIMKIIQEYVETKEALELTRNIV